MIHADRPALHTRHTPFPRVAGMPILLLDGIQTIFLCAFGFYVFVPLCLFSLKPFLLPACLISNDEYEHNPSRHSQEHSLLHTRPECNDHHGDNAHRAIHFKLLRFHCVSRYKI